MIIAGAWFDTSFPNVYNYYLNKGKKPSPISLVGREDIINEYFGKSPERKNYVKVAQGIRELRNFLIHSIQIGGHINADGVKLISKRETFKNYKDWEQISSLEEITIRRDFTSKDEQMRKDFLEIKQALNVFWKKPIQDFE
ncbi:MAG: hypothetical protein ABIN89_02020 [Chitinophagaceae bacterium]